MVHRILPQDSFDVKDPTNTRTRSFLQRIFKDALCILSRHEVPTILCKSFARIEGGASSMSTPGYLLACSGVSLLNAREESNLSSVGPDFVAPRNILDFEKQ